VALHQLTAAEPRRSHISRDAVTRSASRAADLTDTVRARGILAANPAPPARQRVDAASDTDASAAWDNEGGRQTNEAPHRTPQRHLERSEG
jgi:hypothetical protein